MESMPELTTFFGWCSVINGAMLTFATVVLMIGKRSLVGMQARMFGLDREDMLRGYLSFLSGLKILWLVFNLTPWLALTLMA